MAKKKKKPVMNRAREQNEPVAITDTSDVVATADTIDDEPEVPIPEGLVDKPERSPYTSPACSVSFAHSMAAMIHRDIICVSAELKRLCSNGDEVIIDVPPEAGHVLVHYLYTRTWQILQRGDLTRFETCLYVYAAAQTYGLLGLAELAKQNITRYASELSLQDVITLAANPCEILPEDDPWFLAYIRVHIKQLFGDPDSLDQTAFLACLNSRSKYSRVLAKILVSICCQKAASAGSAEAHAVSVADEASSTDTLDPISDSASDSEPNPPRTPTPRPVIRAPEPSIRFNLCDCGCHIPSTPAEERAVEDEPEEIPLSRKLEMWATGEGSYSRGSPRRSAAYKSEWETYRDAMATHFENRWKNCSKCSTTSEDSSTSCRMPAADNPSSESEPSPPWLWHDWVRRT
ncbi:hypothetical protein LX32DRAFT_704709 [Colletotrichum zoysiae]|uniref:BTB domain-containing protein n=1 Tax=Colletotrichum zoysiae TaxID=1216348 RepID=A0AAD9HAZ7_9PEZI|nr:hypothetical protein LX32DRAFT_704709 [Colletotrichum zoysiae]